MRRILLPIEETTRSLMVIPELKKNYSPKEYEIVLLMVDEKIDYTAGRGKSERAIEQLEQKLELVESALDDYYIIKCAEVGKAGQKIVKCARDYGADLIIMTKSAKEDMKDTLGRTTEYVVSHAACNVLIVSEEKNADNEYRGLVYKKAEANVNLRGRLSLKQSECLIPSVSSDCIYNIGVTRGKIRFLHNSYNRDTRNWDLPPKLGDEEVRDIVAGESVSITVRANSVNGKADRIRIINRNMKTEAVFSYRITPVIDKE